MKAGPAVNHTYVIKIPGFESEAYLISAAPVPTPARGQAQVSYMGETYYFPTSVELASGDWSVTLYETGLMEVLRAFYTSFIGDLGKELFTVDIYSYQADYSFAIHTQLYNCWVKSFSAKSLDGSAASDVVACSMVLSYNGVALVENLDDNPTMNLVKYLKLHALSRAGTLTMGAVDLAGSLFGEDLGLQAKAKNLDVVTTELLGANRLLKTILNPTNL
jgi:hypothetical protein